MVISAVISAVIRLVITVDYCSNYCSNIKVISILLLHIKRLIVQERS